MVSDRQLTEGESEPRQPTTSFARRVLHLTARLEDGLLVLLLVAMIGLAITQIVLRNLFASGILWGDACVRVLVLWVGLLGAMVAARNDKQITVDVLSRILPQRWRDGMRVVTDLFTALVSAVVAWHAARLVLDEYQYHAIAFANVPAWLCQSVLPLAFGIIGLRYLAFAVVHLGQAVKRQERA